MSIRESARRVMERMTGTPNEYGEVEPQPSSERPDEGDSGPRYLQWYEADSQKYEVEDQAMRALGFAGRAYQDGRLVYTGLAGDATVAIFLDHFHPLKPPTLFILSGEPTLPGDAINPDGSVNLFFGDHHWNPNEMTASILITWLEELSSQCEAEVVTPGISKEEEHIHEK